MSVDGKYVFVYVPANDGSSVNVETTFFDPSAAKPDTIDVAFSLSLPPKSTALIKYVPSFAGTTAVLLGARTTSPKGNEFNQVAPDVFLLYLIT